jgi:hypothetical protein
VVMVVNMAGSLKRSSIIVSLESSSGSRGPGGECSKKVTWQSRREKRGFGQEARAKDGVPRQAGIYRKEDPHGLPATLSPLSSQALEGANHTT